MSSFFDRVYRLVALVPAGKVASYGQIAALLGDPRAGRTVGWALHASPEGSGLPWQRIINVHGRISNSGTPDAALRQRELLELEGILFGPDGRIDMDVYRWSGPSFEELDAIRRPESASQTEQDT